MIGALDLCKSMAAIYLPMVVPRLVLVENSSRSQRSGDPRVPPRDGDAPPRRGLELSQIFIQSPGGVRRSGGDALATGVAELLGVARSALIPVVGELGPKPMRFAPCAPPPRCAGGAGAATAASIARERAIRKSSCTNCLIVKIQWFAD